MNPTTAEIVAYLREWAEQENREVAHLDQDGWYDAAETQRAHARGLTEAANEIEARW